MKEKTLEEQMKEVYDDLAKAELEVISQNNDLLKSIGRSAKRMFSRIMEGCDLNLYEKLSIVEKPQGELQPEKYGIFKEIWIQQWSTGMEGDTYGGYIYARYDTDKWLKIPYSC